MSDNSLYLEEDARIAAAQKAYDDAIAGKMPADDTDLEAWKAFDVLDRAEFAKYNAVVIEVREARQARAGENRA
jgi:hypothetical protein